MIGASPTVEGPMFKQIQSAAEKGLGLGNLDPESVQKIYKAGKTMARDTIWTVAGNYMDQFHAGTLTSVNQLKDDKIFNNLPDEARNAIYQYVAQPYLGTQQGELNRKAGQISVDSFPPTDGSDVGKAYYDTQIKIMSTVPAPFADDLLKELDKKRQEMAGNGGNLKPETEITTNLSRGVNAYLKGQMFGDYTENPTDTTESKASTKATDAANGVKEQVMNGGKIGNDTYPSGPPKTSHEAYQRLESAMQKRIQASDASEVFKKKEQHGAIWKLFHPFAPASASNAALPQDETSMNFSTPIGRVTSYGYKGDTTPDANSSAGIGAFTKHLIAGQSFSTSYDIEQKFRDAGIKPNDKVELTLSNGEKVVKIWHDRGATPEQARKMGLRNYSGRFDFYSPNGPDKRSDMAVVGFRKAENA
jgi:hypothetical protein